MIDTAFSFTRRQFRRWPVIEVYDLLDYSVADKYADQYPYIWLKNEKETIRDDFDWSWQPSEGQESYVHCFSKCLTEFNKPISWNVLKLVSTNPNRRQSEIAQPLIACWEVLSRTIVFYSNKVRKANKEKFYRYKKRFPDAIYIDNKDSVAEIVQSLAGKKLQDNVYVFNIDIDLDSNFNFDFIPDENKVFQYRLSHSSSGFAYEDENAICFNSKSLDSFLSRQNSIETLDEIVGTLNDYKDPYDAWISAYKTGVMLNSDHIKPKVHKNKILTELISHDVTRIDQFLQDGVQTALLDYDSLGSKALQNIKSFEYLKNRFRERQEEKQNLIVNQNANAARLRAQFGSDSDEYQQALKSI